MTQKLSLIKHDNSKAQNSQTGRASRGAGCFSTRDKHERKFHSLLLGTRLQVGGKNFTGSFEGAYVHTWPDDFDQDDFFRIALALEKRINENLWLVFSLGKNTGSENSDNDLFAVGSIKFGYSTKSAQPR